jgi:pseudo-rSAM protein
MHNRLFFYIEPYIYSILIKDRLLFYNTFTHKHDTYRIESEQLFDFINRLLEKSKLRTIEVSDNDLECPDILSFIQSCREIFIADLINCKGKPLIMAPLPKVNYNVRTAVANQKDEMLNVRTMVKELNIFLNTTTTQCLDNELLKTGYKQCLFPIFQSDSLIKPNFNMILKSFPKFNFNKSNRINVLGNFCDFEEIENMLLYLDTYNLYFHTYYLDFDLKNGNVEIMLKHPNINYVFWIDNLILQKKFDMLLSFIKNNSLSASFKIIVSNKKDMIEMQNKMNHTDIMYDLIPFFDFTNIDFFENEVFNREIEITNQQLSEREIFSRMYINSYYYGRLFILPDGETYTNLYDQPNGNLIHNSEKELMKNLISSNESWFKIRNTIEPCNKCVFQFICPPISNYEFALKRMNLCTYNLALGSWR